MSWMSRTLLTMAASMAASPLHEDQTGRQHGGIGGELLATGFQVTADEGGMFWNFAAWEGT